MNLSDVDLKILWSKAAGRCSCPGCSNICVSFFEKSGEKFLAEMAHIIPQSSEGPRGIARIKGPDSYKNLILLCPYHHEMVDKAPADFPTELLRQWKNQHELRIEQSLAGLQFIDAKSLFAFAEKILIENRAIHQKFGPESAASAANPLSEGAALWSLRKRDTILPNNRKIINAFERNHDYLSVDQWKTFIDFREHALALERNSYERLDREIVPRFPLIFQEMLVSYAKEFKSSKLEEC
jgi:hypothetical protein